jgi:hypothetical protein
MFKSNEDKNSKASNKDKSSKKEKGASEKSLAFSQEIMEFMDTAEKMLENSPQSIEVRGSLNHLKAAKGSLAQAGKFQQVKE